MNKMRWVAAWIGLYWALIAWLGELRSDHFLIGGVILLLNYSGRYARRILSFIFPVLLTGIVYDSQRYFSDYLRGRVRVREPYLFDKFLFGIPTSGGVLTPNEWFQLHTHPILDALTGLAYLTFVVIFIATAAYFYFRLAKVGTQQCTPAEIQQERSGMMWSFFWLNFLGYSTYYWYPAAPPWYVALHGLGPADLTALPNVAGCARFDELIGFPVFGQMYARSADVFGAIPSLHIAYPLLTVWYAFRFGALRWFSVGHFLLMCFAAVYLNHHYILDIIWGAVYALVVPYVLVTMRRGFMAKKSTNSATPQFFPLS